MKTGVIMAIADGKATVMKTGGTFVTVAARPSWRLGDVVQLEKTPAARRAPALLAACLVLAMLAGVSATLLYFGKSTLISVDVNPSVEIWLNRFDRVVSVESRNDEGLRLSRQMDVRNKTYEEALGLLLSSDFLEGYLRGGDGVTITVLSGREDRQAALLTQVEETADRALLTQNIPARVECYSVNSAMVQDAHQHGVTPGKYLYLLKLQEAAPDIDINDYAHCSIGELKGQIDECHNAHGGGAGGHGQGHGAGRGRHGGRG